MIEENELGVKGSSRCPVKVTTSVFAWEGEGNVSRTEMWKIQWAVSYRDSCFLVRPRVTENW